MIQQGGANVENQYVSLVAFEEAKRNKQVANYIKYTGRDKVDGFGEYAWIDALLFGDVVNNIVADGGNNALTRKAPLAELAHSFDADGMWGATDIAGRNATPRAS